MVTTKFDTDSDLHLEFPDKNKPLDVVTTVESYLDYESSLPPEEQLPQTPRLTELLERWIASDDSRSKGEHQRAKASESVKQLDQMLSRYVRRMRKTIDAAFPESPVEAKAWGFNSKQTTQNILLPRTRKEHLIVLNKYIAYEQSRPEEERFTNPPLAEVIELRDELRQQLKVRATGQTQREKSAADSSAITLEMYNQLQGAVVYLLNFKFDFIVTVELENWGFEVVTRRSASTEEADETAVATDAPAEAEAAPQPAPETTTPEATSTNGAYTNGSTNDNLDLMPDALLNGRE